MKDEEHMPDNKLIPVMVNPATATQMSELADDMGLAPHIYEMRDACRLALEATVVFRAEAGVEIVEHRKPDGYELVMPSGNRNIWFDDKESAIYCAQVVGSCWLEAEACGALEERAITKSPTPVESEAERLLREIVALETATPIDDAADEATASLLMDKITEACNLLAINPSAEKLCAEELAATQENRLLDEYGKGFACGEANELQRIALDVEAILRGAAEDRSCIGWENLAERIRAYFAEQIENCQYIAMDFHQQFAKVESAVATQSPDPDQPCDCGDTGRKFVPVSNAGNKKPDGSLLQPGDIGYVNGDGEMEVECDCARSDPDQQGAGPLEFTKLIAARGCRKNWAQWKNVETCLDHEAVARDPDSSYADEFRPKILTGEHRCDSCRAAAALEATSQGQSVSDGAGLTHVFRELAAERRRQDEKFGEQNHDPLHWIAILTEEVGEAAKEAVDHAAGKTGLSDYRAEMVQTAAVAINAIESFDRQHAESKTLAANPTQEGPNA